MIEKQDRPSAVFYKGEPVIADPDNLRELVAAVARRDRTAFKGLYDRTSGRLFGIVSKIVRDRGAAEDVLQEIYLRIWEKASTFKPEMGSPLAWMITIARNRAIDLVRQRSLHSSDKSADDDDLLRHYVMPDTAPDFADRDGLHVCLKRLDEEQRDCIVLAYCGGYSREELAVRFDHPVNTIKTWLHRGLAALKTCLEAS